VVVIINNQVVIEECYADIMLYNMLLGNLCTSAKKKVITNKSVKNGLASNNRWVSKIKWGICSFVERGVNKLGKTCNLIIAYGTTLYTFYHWLTCCHGNRGGDCDSIFPLVPFYCNIKHWNNSLKRMKFPIIFWCNNHIISFGDMLREIVGGA
jgi:hypothetical protein